MLAGKSIVKPVYHLSIFRAPLRQQRAKNNNNCLINILCWGGTRQKRYRSSHGDDPFGTFPRYEGEGVTFPHLVLHLHLPLL